MIEKILTNWEPRDQKLVFLGNYIDRANYLGNVLKLLWELQKSHPEMIQLKGNHEYFYKIHYIRESQTDWSTVGERRTTILDVEKEKIKTGLAIAFLILCY